MRAISLALVLALLWTGGLVAAPAAPQFPGATVQVKEFHVTSTPPGAAVTLMDTEPRYQGVTPVSFSAAANTSHQIKLTLDGYNELTARLELGETEKHVDLAPATPGAWIAHQYRYSPALAWPVTALILAAFGAVGFLLYKRYRGLNQRIVEAELESKNLVGRVVGDYRIDERLGEGAFSEVYRVEHMTYHDQFAMKVLKPDFMESDWLTRFHREMEVGRDLQHPNLVRVFAFGEIRNAPYLVMEYLKGRTLDDVLARRRLSVSEALDVATKVAEGLAFAHARGIIHRDLKPDNIMILEDGGVRVMDFGIAKFLDRQKLTQTGTALGTPRYMSPEHLRSKDMDARSDVYSLGVILYEMLSGHIPFSGEDSIQVITAHVSQPPPPLPDSIPPEMAAVVMKMLAKRPIDRYQTLGEVLDALGCLEDAAR